MKELSSKKAYEILMESSELNPGSWVDRSIHVAKCARKIAEKTDLDPDQSQSYGYLYDIGRRFGNTGLRHIIDGYNFLMKEGYEEAARICLTHSFAVQDIKNGIGKLDLNEEEYRFVDEYINNIKYDDYDRLIQLCDSLALPTGPTLVERRLMDVDLRYGVNDKTVENWKAILNIQADIERKLGYSIYKLFPEVCKNIELNPVEEILKIK